MQNKTEMFRQKIAQKQKQKYPNRTNGKKKETERSSANVDDK
jgi:hypothetical protein